MGKWDGGMRRFSFSAQQRTQVAARSVHNGEASGSLTIVELEHAAQTLSANDLTIRLTDFVDGIDELIVQPSVIALGVPLAAAERIALVAPTDITMAAWRAATISSGEGAATGAGLADFGLVWA